MESELLTLTPALAGILGVILWRVRVLERHMASIISALATVPCRSGKKCDTESGGESSNASLAFP